MLTIVNRALNSGLFQHFQLTLPLQSEPQYKKLSRNPYVEEPFCIIPNDVTAIFHKKFKNSVKSVSHKKILNAECRKIKNKMKRGYKLIKKERRKFIQHRLNFLIFAILLWTIAFVYYGVIPITIYPYRSSNSFMYQ